MLSYFNIKDVINDFKFLERLKKLIFRANQLIISDLLSEFYYNDYLFYLAIILFNLSSYHINGEMVQWLAPRICSANCEDGSSNPTVSTDDPLE